MSRLRPCLPALVTAALLPFAPAALADPVAGVDMQCVSPAGDPAPNTPEWVQRDTINQYCAGLRNREIAEELMVSTRTVEFHLTNIYAKLGFKSRAQLVARGVEASTWPPSLTPGGRATH